MASADKPEKGGNFLQRLLNRTPADPSTTGLPTSESGRGHDLLARPRGGAVGFVIPDEYKAELQGQRGFKKYDEMFKGDPDVRRSYMMLGAPAIGATWAVEPYGDDKATPAAQEQAEFVEWCLFEAMRPKWPAHLMQAWRVLRYGNAPFEQVYRKDTWTPRPKPAPDAEAAAKPGEKPNPAKPPPPNVAGGTKPGKPDQPIGLFQAGPPSGPPSSEKPVPGAPAGAAGAQEQFAEPELIPGKPRDVLCIDQLHLKLPRTIWRYESIGERLLALTQFVVGGEFMPGEVLMTDALSNLGAGPAMPGEIRLPAEDLLFYRLGAEGDNWEGESLLRPVYKSWKFKETLEIVEAIGHERYHVGMPVGYPPQGASDDSKRGLDDVLGKIRSNETGHITMPGPKQNADGEGWLIEILTPSAGEGGSDIRASIEGHRDGISAGLFTEFMRLGQGAAGSKGALSTATAQQDPFYALIEAFISVYIEDPVNEQLVQRLVKLNFTEAEIKEAGGFPELHASKIDAIAADAIATAIAALITAGAIHPDDELEDAMRDRMDMPPADPKARVERKVGEAQALEHQQALEKAGVAPKPGDAGQKVTEIHAPQPMGGVKKVVETRKLAQEQEHTGAMVALVPTAQTAAALAVPGGEPADQLHVTLAYLGDADALSDEEVQGLLAEVRDWATKTGQINGHISGYGVFDQDPPVTYLSFDAPALPRARQDLVDRLDHAGVPADRAHGFTPHMTVAYGAANSPDVASSLLRFHQVEVRLGGRRITFPLRGKVQLRQHVVEFDPSKHPRDPATGEWKKVTIDEFRDAIVRLPHGHTAVLPSGVSVTRDRHLRGMFHVDRAGDVTVIGAPQEGEHLDHWRGAVQRYHADFERAWEAAKVALAPAPDLRKVYPITPITPEEEAMGEARDLTRRRERSLLAQVPAKMAHVDFAALRAYLDQAKFSVSGRVAGELRDLLAHPDDQGARDRLTKAFEEAFTAVADHGRALVRAETSRVAPMLLAQPSPKRSMHLVVEVAVLAAESVIRTLEGTAQRLAALGTPAPEAAKRLEQTVMAAADREARDGVTLALNAGRMTEGDELGGDVRVLYTSILDENRCEQCAAADDDIARKLDDPIRLAHRPPNPNCYGWTRCRCIEVYVFDEPTTLTAGDGDPGPFDPWQGSRFTSSGSTGASVERITLAWEEAKHPREHGGEHGGEWAKANAGGTGVLDRITVHDPVAYSKAKAGRYGFYPSLEVREGWKRETMAVLGQAMTRYPRLRHPADGRPLRDVVFTSNGRAPYVKEIRQIQDGTGIAAVVNSDDMGDHCVLAINDFTPQPLPSPVASRIGCPATVSGRTGAVWHEVGHLLAQAQGVDDDHPENVIAALREYGIDFEDVAELSPYAASSPAEAIGELSAMIHTPGFAEQLYPDLRENAERMFAAWGGATS